MSGEGLGRGVVLYREGRSQRGIWIGGVGQCHVSLHAGGLREGVGGGEGAPRVVQITLSPSGLSLHRLLVGAAARVLGLHHVWELRGAGEGINAEGLKDIFTGSEGQANCCWGLRSCCLAGEATVSEGFAVIQQLVILV